MIKIKLNKARIIEVKEEKNLIYADNQKLDWNLSKISENDFHVLLHNKSYRVQVVEKDLKNKMVSFRINGKLITAEGKNELDLLLEKMGIAEQKAKRVRELKAPMPGLILSIDLKEGQEVKKGEVLVILEAMKMENVLKAAEDCSIKKIHVKSGEAVEKNQILLEFN